MSETAGVGRQLFLNRENELRSGWRILIFLFLFSISVLLSFTVANVLSFFFPFLGSILEETRSDSILSLVGFGIRSVILFASLSLATAIAARWLEHRTFLSVGFKLHKEWPRDFAFGSLIGVLTLGLAVGLEAAGGAVELQPRTIEPMASVWFIVVFFVFLIAAAFEELLVRGFLFQAIERSIGPAAAVAITSIVFALLHLGNDNATIFSTLNTALAGAWLGIAYLLTRSLWLATGLHYSWNLAMGFVFGLPVSGEKMVQSFSLVTGASRQPVWLSGGEYGPEGGAATTIAVVISTIVIWKSGLFRASDEMLQASKHGSAQTPESLRVTP